MNPTILYTIISLSATGIAAAIILYIIARRFRVIEDPRIDEAEDALPSANCGGCGYPGCRNFAEACVKADKLDDLYCPVGGNDTMTAVAKILGMEASEKDPQVAVVRCSGSFACRPRTNSYDGAASCSIASSLYSGDTGCQFGCLGHGDCTVVCNFDAIHVVNGLATVDYDKCVGCGACGDICPRNIITIITLFTWLFYSITTRF